MGKIFCEWDDSLEGKLVIAADYLSALYTGEARNIGKGYVCKSAIDDFPFKIKDVHGYDMGNYRYCMLYEKQTRRMTNRELAKWLAQNNGQCYYDGSVRSFYSYQVHDDASEVPDNLQIRGWDETEWREPKVEA